MPQQNQKHIDFVLRHYQTGKLDTRKAVQLFHQRTGTARTIHLRRLLAAAATLLLLFAAGAYVWLRPTVTTLAAGDSAIMYTLPDSTRVTLSPHSTLSYTGNNCRQVRMTGKAYFEVRRLPPTGDRLPATFDITGDISHVRVLGTQFEVNEGKTASTVYVTEGRVLFAAKDTDDGIILTRGMCATLKRGADKPRLTPSPSANSVAWATHHFHFSDTPIQDVLTDLSAYYGMSLSTNATDKRLTADFNTDNPNEIIRMIERTLNIKIRL